MQFVSIQEAEAHLRMDEVNASPDVAFKLTQAHAIVLDFIQNPAAESWTKETVPFAVTAAILIVLSDLYENRQDANPLSDAVRALLSKHKVYREIQ